MLIVKRNEVIGPNTNNLYSEQRPLARIGARNRFCRFPIHLTVAADCATLAIT